MTIAHPRSLQPETPVQSAERVIVAAPRTAHGRKAAERLHRALGDLGARSELLSDPTGGVLTSAGGPVCAERP